MTVRIIDIETTGTDPQADAIVEIAAVDIKPGGGIVNDRQYLIKPPIPIPPEASAIHHILDEDVADCPALREVIDEFAGADAYVAHNADFERGFLNNLLLDPKSERPPQWICTYKCALRLWPDFPSHSNQALRYRLGHTNPLGYKRNTGFTVAHRAFGDVIATACIFQELLAKVRWSQLVQWSNEPALHTKLHFGKYRGQRYDAVDPSYLEWLTRQADMDAGIKFSAAHWLSQRAA